MAYPDAYCVKCGTKTETQNKHTVVLTNNSRAMRGECPKCASDVYKILPKDRDYSETNSGMNKAAKPEIKSDSAAPKSKRQPLSLVPALVPQTPLDRRSSRDSSTDGPRVNAYLWVGIGMICGAVSVFVAYALLR